MKLDIGAKKTKPLLGSNIELDRFFQAVNDRRIADAEKELDSIRTSIPATERAKGYLKACEGLLLTAKAGSDRYLYLSKNDKTQKRLTALRKVFSAEVANTLHTEYDRGYFQVLVSYVKMLERADQPQENQSNVSKSIEKKH